MVHRRAGGELGGEAGEVGRGTVLVFPFLLPVHGEKVA